MNLFVCLCKSFIYSSYFLYYSTVSLQLNYKLIYFKLYVLLKAKCFKANSVCLVLILSNVLFEQKCIMNIYITVFEPSVVK